MRYDENHVSPNVIDRRGQGGGGGFGILFALLPWLIRHPILLIGVLLIGGAVWAVNRFMGGDPRRAMSDESAIGQPAQDKELAFVSFVLDDTQKTWRGIFQDRGQQYRDAKLVAFSNQTSSSCGLGSAATGPFYCPRDERVYIDLSFFDELSRRFSAPGDFARAYVIAHEVGHHVQNQLGTSDRVHAAPRSQQTGADGLSVRLELQADCYAGVWAHSTDQRKLLEEGDIEEGLRAASAIGDDRLQRQARGTVSPESFTHGTSAQRSHWFNVGYESGAVDRCDTFRTASL